MNELRRVAAGGPPQDERALYEADEHAWIEWQTAALREGRLDDLDRPHLIEFLNDMTARDRRELESRLIVLLHHPHARLEAAEDTGLPLSTFPTESPWTAEDALAFAFPVRE